MGETSTLLCWAGPEEMGRLLRSYTHESELDHAPHIAILSAQLCSMVLAWRD